MNVLQSSSEERTPALWEKGPWPWLMLALFSLLSFSFKIGTYPLTDRDETLYSQVARELLRHRDWWTLFYQDKPWFIHAPLSMWIQAAVFKTFGVSEFTARMPSVLFGIGLVLVSAALGTVLFGRRTGLFAGFIMVSSPIVFLISRMAILDMPFTFFITLAMLFFVLAWRNQNRKLYPAFWLAVGFATLGKGLWGMVLPVMVSFLYAITDRNRKRLLDWSLYASALVWAAVALPWIIINTHRHGSDFIRPVLVTNTYARMTTSICHHHGPWWFYIPLIVVALFPWSVLWPRAFFRLRGDNGRLLALWVVPALILHSIAATKLPNYLLPFMPAFAMMLASYIADAKRKRIQAVALPLIGGALAAAILIGLRDFKWLPLHPNPYVLVAYMVGAYGIAGIALVRLKDAGVPVAAICLVLVLSLMPITYSRVSGELAPKSLAMQARRIAGGDPVMTHHETSCAGGFYYYAGRPFVEAPSMDELARLVSARHGKCLLVLEDYQTKLLVKRGIRLREIARTHKWVILQPVGE